MYQVFTACFFSSSASSSTTGRICLYLHKNYSNVILNKQYRVLKGIKNFRSMGVQRKSELSFLVMECRGSLKAPLTGDSNGQTVPWCESDKRKHHKPEGCNGRAQHLPCQESVVLQHTSCSQPYVAIPENEPYLHRIMTRR